MTRRVVVWLLVFIVASSVSWNAGPAEAGQYRREVTGDYMFQYLVGPNDDGSAEVCEVRPDCNVILTPERGERFVSVSVTEASGAPTPFEILNHTGEEVLGTYCGTAESFRIVGRSVRLHFVNPNSCGQSTIGSYSITFTKSALPGPTGRTTRQG